MAVEKKKPGRKAKVANLPIPAKTETGSTTQVKSVKVEERKEDLRPLRKGDRFLIVKNGQDVYLTRSVINAMLLRNSASIEIPKGSDYTPPKDTQCDGC